MRQEVCFQVDMEYVCNLARDMLWLEGKELNYCLDLVKSILSHPDFTDEHVENLAIEILEGRKIVRGINSGQIFDDNQKIRPLIDLIRKQEKELSFNEFEKHMNSHPTIYVDDACGGFSMRNPVMDRSSEPLTPQQVILYRLTGSIAYGYGYADTNHPLQAGSYLLQEPKLAFEILNGKCRSRSEVVQKCTDYWNKRLLEWKNEGLTYETMSEYQKAVYDRGRYVRKNDGFPFKVELKVVTEAKESNDKVKTDISELESMLQEDIAISNFKNSDDEDSVSLNSQPDPQDTFLTEHGWISPEGVYYSTKFGGHEVKSQVIIEANPELQEEFSNFFSKYKKPHLDRYKMSSLFLEERGWGRFGDQQLTGISTMSLSHSQQPTEKQKETCSKVGVFFKLTYDPVDFIRHHYTFIEMGESEEGEGDNL